MPSVEILLKVYCRKLACGVRFALFPLVARAEWGNFDEDSRI
jgi:hypothetical protein